MACAKREEQQEKKEPWTFNISWMQPFDVSIAKDLWDYDENRVIYILHFWISFLL